MDLKELIKVAGRNWDVLEELRRAEYDKEARGRCYVSGLAKALGKAKSEMSGRLRELKDAGLIEPEQREGERKKYYALSLRGKRIVKAIIGAAEEKAEEPIKLGEPDPEQLDFVLRKLDEVSTDEVHKAALEDFSKLCRRTRIWKFGDKAWPVIRKNLSNVEGEDSVKFLSCLSDAIENMLKLSEEKDIQEVKSSFFKDIEEAYKRSISPKLLAFQKAASHIIAMLASEDEKIRIYKDALEGVIERDDIKNFSEVGGIASIYALLDFKLSEDQKKDLREWFYTLMASENETVRKKALYAYEVASSKL